MSGRCESNDQGSGFHLTYTVPAGTWEDQFGNPVALGAQMLAAASGIVLICTDPPNRRNQAMRNGETLLAAAVIVLGTYALAWAATNVTNTTGTSTVGNAACFDNATATSIKDCGVQPNTAVTGSGYAVLQDSPVLTTVTTVRGNSATVPMNMDYNGVPSANYIIDQITGGGFNASSSDISYGQIQFIAASNTAGSEQGRVILQAKNSGAMKTKWRWPAAWVSTGRLSKAMEHLMRLPTTATQMLE